MSVVVVDGTRLRCVQILLKLRSQVQEAEVGTVIRVITEDPTAPLDLAAWCHMTGHHYLGEIVGGDEVTPVYELRVELGAHATQVDRPWRRA
ncbi:sulfurtransferase TusA family protein [Streptomyces chiangmaiensis]|uniref:Sulfurtransferase TusA family protein n=1 Tax=Streptomyces chiangmaiensis TaxID=766497 RepID=A0ABU7FMI9_9ACTN|nr:sulfurtransferase TusA family protein [Streptomyces chiangmaiensis]MED7825038.1 sulfurtransferase TusA family protein [Streptomyces chiangmaiensis]